MLFLDVQHRVLQARFLLLLRLLLRLAFLLFLHEGEEVHLLERFFGFRSLHDVIGHHVHAAHKKLRVHDPVIEGQGLVHDLPAGGGFAREIN